MDTKLQLADKLKAATNILVTVSNNPTVDQLAACIGMTLWLNKINKHATAVFSGDIPSTLEFLKPEETLEKNTDSLRDFIIALDKSKADKLRYKVEDRVVKIFITPYRTSLSEDDLEFSQGDFNVDAVVAIGVTKQEDLDQAIVSHGRILHDAVVATINASNDGGLGSINWHETSTSSLSELAYDLCQAIDDKQLDPQIATAFLTGIVAETARFSNDKTTPNTMSVAAALMGAGANQQLVANKLEEARAAQASTSEDQANNGDASEQSSNGTLEINHEVADGAHEPTKDEEEGDQPAPQPVEANPSQEITDVKLQPPTDQGFVDEQHPSEAVLDNKFVNEPPQRGGTLTANSQPQDEPEPVMDPMSLPPVDSAQLLNHGMNAPVPDSTAQPRAISEQPEVPQEQPPPGPAIPDKPAPSAPVADSGETLSKIEEEVHSPHLGALRSQVDNALGGGASNEGTTKSPSEFNPADFTIDEHDEDPNSLPQVPPPIVPPNFLPPEPPAST